MIPKFSIIIPVYNVAPYLRECLDSILAQSFTGWEAICVDDGSTDASGAILDEYKEKVERLGGDGQRTGKFVVIHQKNAGVSAARNAALDVARGEWIGFLDADDMSLPSWLANVAEAIDQNSGVDVIRTGWISWEGQRRIPRSQCGASPIRFAQGESSTVFFWRAISQCSYPFVVFYRKNGAPDLRYVKGVRFREDALFQYSLALEGLELVVIPEDGYLHREREGSATLQSRRIDDSWRLLGEYLAIWEKLPTGRMRCQCKAASTFWLAKDVGQWFRLCRMRRFGDSFKVWICMWRLVLSGAFSPFSQGTVFDGLRRFLYLASGLGEVLSFTRLSLKRGKRNG